LAGGAFVLCSVAFVLCTLALNAGSEDKTSDWISAFGTAFGAALTGGALLIAAVTYKHQVDERNREADDRRRQELDERKTHAIAVKLGKVERPGYNEWACGVRNDGSLAIDGVGIVAVDAEGVETLRHQVGIVPPAGSSERYPVSTAATNASYVTFQDANGRTWKRYFDNRLEEQSPVPA
jgi:hypothetical protein